ncbi:MAG: sensor histidine kinase, partial [Candidatus Neomarinimicrobiota bacterium]
GKDVPDEYELALRNLKGEQIFAEIKAAVIDYEGKPADLVFVRDITKRKKAKEKLNLDLETTNKQLHELSSHMEIVREEERTNIAREIHDELGQALTALKMDLAWLTKKFPDVPSSITEKRDSMKNIINDTIQSVKKISTELRPGILDDLGLSAALEWQTEEFNKRSGIACDTRSNPEEIVTDPARSTAIFRIFQECLTNVSRHSKATKVKVRLKDDHGILTLTVSDNGKGISESDIENPTSYGLKGIQERVYPWNGTVKITGSPGKGTVLIAIIPQSN